MAWLPSDVLKCVYMVALELDLDRDALLGATPVTWRRTLRSMPTPAAQIAHDLDTMNETEPLDDGQIPLVAWLMHAEQFTRKHRKSATFRAALAQIAKKIGATEDLSAGLSMSQPWFDALTYPFEHPKALVFRDLLVIAYPTRDRAYGLATDAGIGLGYVNWSAGIVPIWNDILRDAASQKRVLTLLQRAIGDRYAEAIRAQLQSLIE